MKTKNNIKNQRNKELALGQNKQDWQNLSEMNQKKEKTQINKIRNKKWTITTDISEIQKFIRTTLQLKLQEDTR